MVDRDMHRAVKMSSCLVHTFPDEAEQGKVVPSCFNSNIVDTCPFHGPFSAMFVFKFLLVIPLFEMVSKHRAEVLSSVPKHKKAVMCLMEKIMYQMSFIQA